MHTIRAVWKHSELTATALRHKQSKGERTGSIPYGYTLAADGINLLPDDAEQAAITQAQKLRESGLSLRKVAAELFRRGLYARNGSQFQATQILRMLTAYRPLYKEPRP